MNFLQAFGNNVKAVVGGMLVGICLLPVGVIMQKCAVDQMQYHKYFDKAVAVSDSSDSKIGEETIIKTEGEYTLSDNSPYTVKTEEGDLFEGKYISYSIDRYFPKKEVKETKDSNGNRRTETTYKWVKEEGGGVSSPDSLTVTVNGFTDKFNSFRQKYIEPETISYKYVKGLSSDGSRAGMGGEISARLLEKYDGMAPKPDEGDIMDNTYLKVLSGYLYDESDKTMTICGIANSGSNQLTPIMGRWGQSMLVVSYGNFTDTLQSTKTSASSERLAKFIIGTLCFIAGFSGIFGPIIKILDFIPVIGDLAIGLIYFILAIVSLILSVLFYIFFQFFWLILALAIIIPLGLFFYGKFFKNA